MFREKKGSGESSVTIAGWVTDVDEGNSMLTIRDQQGLVTLTIDEWEPAGASTGRLSTLAVESVVEITGGVLEREDDHFTLGAASIDVISEPERPLAFDPSDRPVGDFGTRLRNRHLDLRGARPQAILKIRAEVFSAIRSKLRDWGAIEFDTPILVPAVTDTRNHQFSVSYSDKDARLIGHHSNQYNQLLIAGGFERIFSIQRSFGYHEEALVHPWGVVETTLIHIESAFTDQSAFLDLIEDLVIHAYEHVEEHCQDELETLDVDLTVPYDEFRRVPYEEFLELANEIDDETEYGRGEEVEWWTQRAVMDRIGEYHFVTGLPAAARDVNEKRPTDDSEIVTSFDLNKPDFEIMFGSEREYRHDRLEAAIESREGLDADQLRWFLDAFKDGVPPHAGGTMGFDRLLMGMLDLRDMREGIPFPRDRNMIV